MTMANVKRFIAAFLRPLWIFFFLHPRTIRRQIKQIDWQQRLKMISQAILFPFAMTAIIGAILKQFGIPFNFGRGLTLTSTCVAFSIALSIAGGMVIAVSKGRERGSTFATLFASSASIKFGLVFGLVGGSAFAFPFGSLSSLTLATTLGIILGLAGGTAFALPFNATRNIVLSIVFGITSGIAFGILGDIPFGIKFGITSGIAFGLTFVVGALRVPFLLSGFLTTFWSLVKVKQNPYQASYFLHRSLAYWDEQTCLPQPFLAQLIVAVGRHNKEAARKAITHLTANTYQQSAAKTAWMELGSREMLICRTIKEIGNLAPNSFWLTSASDDIIKKQKWSATDAFARCQKIAADIRSGVAASSDYNKRSAFDGARRQLEELRQMAVLVLRGRESQTFARIAQQWLDVVNAEIERLTAEERVAERIPNPYIAPNPLTAGTETFVGRDNAFRSVEEHFLRSAESAPMVLFGQPRIGKTSLLRNLDKRLPTNLIPIYVDMQRSGLVESTAQLLVNLAKAISQGLAARGFRVRQLSANDLVAEPFSVFDNFLDEVEQAIGATERREAHRLILALDEFEVIEQKLTEGKVSRDLMPYLRSVMQHRRGLSLLFAGTHTLDEMVAELWIPYFRSAVPQRVSYLGEAAARKLVTNPIENFPLDYEPAAGDRLIAETRCHPCLIQLTCSALVDAQNARKSHHATVEDVEEALDKVLKLDGRYVFEGIWDWIPAEERTLLMFIATHEPATIAQAAQALTTPTARISGSVERLIDAEVLEPAEEREEFRFQVPLFRRWVARQAARAGMEWEAPRPVAS